MSQIGDKVRITLNPVEVVSDFRTELFAEARRAGMSAQEFVLRVAAEHLAERGRPVTGVFVPGDVREISL
jgi:hypothetical protein